MSARVTSSADRNAMLAKIHVAKKQLGLMDADYRALLLRAVKKQSAADCTLSELDAVLADMKKCGFHMKPRSSKPHVRKIFVLWRTLGEAGLVTRHSKQALGAWVARMTRSAAKPAGVENIEWLTSAEARPLIEALKDWAKRGAHHE